MEGGPSIKAFYVNLDLDTSRQQSIHKLLTKLGLNFDRSPGVLFKDIPKNDLKIFPPNMVSQAASSKRIATELAIFYSHRLAWQRGLDEGYDYTIVFEDDITTYVSKTKLKNLLVSTCRKGDFDVLYLGKCLDTCSKYEHEFGQIYRTYSPYCAHAYMLSRTTIEFLLQESLTHTAVDNHIRNLIQADKLKAYTFHPSIFIQDVVRFTSNIRDEVSSLNNISECQDVQDQQDASNRQAAIIVAVVIAILVLIILWLIWRRS